MARSTTAGRKNRASRSMGASATEHVKVMTQNSNPDLIVSTSKIQG